MLQLDWNFSHCHKSGAKEDIAVLAEIKQVEIKHIKIPAADGLKLDEVMAIYQALRPIMPAA